MLMRCKCTVETKPRYRYQNIFSA